MGIFFSQVDKSQTRASLLLTGGDKKVVLVAFQKHIKPAPQAQGSSPVSYLLLIFAFNKNKTMKCPRLHL